MQLDKLVNYHKALADPTRVKMLILLAEGEMNGQLLADKLGVSPATITHHAMKLREASLLIERRDKNTIYFSLNHHFMRSAAAATLDVVYQNTKSTEERSESLEDKNRKLKASVIKNFFTSEGRLRHLPVLLKKKLIVLEQLVSRLETGRAYTEKEINAFIKEFHEDFATIRREFIMHQFMFRENQIYELNPPEMWAKWETLT